MLNTQRLDCVQCTTALEVELLAAWRHERNLRLELERTLKQPPPPPKAEPPPAPSEPAPPEPVSETARAPWLRRDRPAAEAKIIDIQRAVCRQFKVTMVELRSHHRDAKTCLARHTAVMLCYALTLHSYPYIGRWFGERDHSTMLHSVRKLKWLHEDLCSELTNADTIETWVKHAHERVTEGRARDPDDDIVSSAVLDIKAERACLSESLGG